MTDIAGGEKTEGRKFLLVAAEFNRWVTDRLLVAAIAELKQRGAADADIDTARVPGSFELAGAAKVAAATGRYAGIACLGAILKGETTHDVHLATACASAIAQAGLDTGIPVTLGVITADTFEQAEARSQPHGSRNVGADAAAAAVRMAALYARLKKPS
jgi:6,7-dimethyl-8-ribityllumazine synthase